MMSKIKDIAISALAIIGAVFYMLFKRNARKAKQAERERDIAKTQADFSDKRMERVNERKEIDDDIAMGDEPHIDERLSKYYRDN